MNSNTVQLHIHEVLLKTTQNRKIQCHQKSHCRGALEGQPAATLMLTWNTDAQSARVEPQQACGGPLCSCAGLLARA